MKKVAVGCVALLVWLVVIPFACVMLNTDYIRSQAGTMFAQFRVGAPVVPFSLVKSGTTAVAFSRKDKPRDFCLTARVDDDEVTLSYAGTALHETVKVDDFPKKIESLREHIAACDHLDVTYFYLPIPLRSSFVVHYDPSGNVTRIEAPHNWD